MSTQNFTYRPTSYAAPPAAHSSFYILNSTLNHSFSAKERDPETGLSYFGSRYYSADLSIWLSVDPMSGKYPYQSNYVYCSNNPLKVIDPNGEDEWEVTDWVLTSDGKVYWDENATSQETTKPGERYLGKAGQFVSTGVGICVMNLYNDGTMREQKAVVIRPQTSSATSGRFRLAEQIGNVENQVTQKGLAFGEGLATALPISSTVNDISILINGENIFGDKASATDKRWAMIGLATIGAGHTAILGGKLGIKAFRKTSEVIDNIEYLLGLRSGFVTTKDKLKNEKEK